MAKVDLHLVGANATECLGACMAGLVQAPCSIWLQGTLGSGKTTFCRGFIRAFNASEKVVSPTYTLLESYAVGELNICHFDFYRITKPDELEFVGVRECFSANNICLIEWPENAGEQLLPTPHMRVALRYLEKEHERGAMIQSSDTHLITNIQQKYLHQCAD